MISRQKLKEFTVKTFHATLKWLAHEFTGQRGKDKFVAVVSFLWLVLKIIGISLAVAIMIFKLLMEIGRSND